MILIPTNFDENAYNAQKVNIDGVSVSMRFLWNEREDAWYADFESVDGANYGVKLQPGRRILLGFNRVANGGDFVIFKTEKSSSEELGFKNFGTTYKLYFVNSEDVGILERYGVL